jgi:hypothetical protein
MSRVGFISVTVNDGVFRSERMVSFADSTGKTVSLLVSSMDLQNDRLRVDVLDGTAESTLIGLPGDPIHGSSRVVLPTSRVARS